MRDANGEKTMSFKPDSNKPNLTDHSVNQTPTFVGDQASSINTEQLIQAGS